MTDSTMTVDVVDLHPATDELRDVVMEGLLSRSKTLPCKLLYDERGSQLFEQICELDEYYPTRTELAIFNEFLNEMADSLGSECGVIEYGSGSSLKSRMLLGALDDPVAYIPIDISREILERSSKKLNIEFPRLEVLPVCADYTQEIELPEPSRTPSRFVVFFPGSTIGNFHLDEAEEFLRRNAKMCGEGGGMLIGVDLRKDRETLERAYNDSAGITAKFTTNILVRLNRELDADFFVDHFHHLAVWNDGASRIEVFLVSQCDQVVHVGGESIQFVQHERIRIEVSYKYDPAVFAALAERAGFHVKHVWTDPQKLFSVQYLEVVA